MSLLAVSCSKDDESPVPVAKVDYYQLKTGNYWIYEGYRVDTNGIATSTGDFDSAYIEKDTLIRGAVYYKLYEKPYVLGELQFSSFLRDSSGYLVSDDGGIRASYVNFTDTIVIDTTNPDLYSGYRKMIGKDSLVTVPAGAFASVTSSMQVIPAPAYASQVPVRYLYDVYGKGVGKMKTHSFFFLGPISIEARLVRYKVN
jgi:hypothetical protein